MTLIKFWQKYINDKNIDMDKLDQHFMYTSGSIECRLIEELKHQFNNAYTYDLKIEALRKDIVEFTQVIKSREDIIFELRKTISELRSQNDTN